PCPGMAPACAQEDLDRLETAIGMMAIHIALHRNYGIESALFHVRENGGIKGHIGSFLVFSVSRSARAIATTVIPIIIPWKTGPDIMIVVQPHADLFEVVLAPTTRGIPVGLLHRDGQKQPDRHYKDGDEDEQILEREPTPPCPSRMTHESTPSSSGSLGCA